MAIDQGRRGFDANGQPINSISAATPRPVDFAGIPNAFSGDGSDIGAVETGLPQSGPTFTVTNTDRSQDGCTTDDCTFFEALTASSVNQDLNTIVFAPGIGPVIDSRTPADQRAGHDRRARRAAAGHQRRKRQPNLLGRFR